MMRLDKYLSENTGMSRENSRKTIRNGKAAVNGEIIKDPGRHVSDTDIVTCDGKTITASSLEYWLLYKTAGYLTARSDPDKPVVMSLIPSVKKDLSPVGRLDEDTEGLLLITNDGMLNHRLAGPKFHVTKKYYVECDKPFPANARELLEAPMVFKDFTTAGAVYEKLSETSCFLTITEGKYHQVKRMMAKLGCEVTYLRRETFGSLTLSGMKPGECRPLTDEEIRELKKE